MKREPLLPGLAKLLLLIVAAVLLFAVPSAVYSLLTFNRAKAQGIYASPEAAVNLRSYSRYCGIDRVVMMQSGPASAAGSGAKIWYVSYEIYAYGRLATPTAPPSPGETIPCPSDTPNLLSHKLNYYAETGYYLNAREGWVLVPKSKSPTMVLYWMELFGLAGSGSV